MIKYLKVICLVLISGGSTAQISTLPIERLPVKNILPGISYIPTRSFTALSYTGSDSLAFYIPKTASTRGFYISKYEVSNKEYREFALWVRDAAAHNLLQHFIKDSKEIDWSQTINWNNPLLESMMVESENRISIKKEINAGMISYSSPRTGKMISIYPDTLVWLTDFSYSYNEPLVKRYFANKNYDNYPVVGINLAQAMAFCEWKEAQVNRSLKQAGSEYRVELRLPTNNEWEAAATDNEPGNKVYPSSKKYRSNFGIIKDKNGVVVKKYDDDGYFYTGPVKDYSPDANGLYNMKGNVAEWTSDEASTIMVNTNNKKIPDSLMDEIKRSFIVKGGGWDSDPFYLQTGACRFFPANASHAFIGFRYVVYITKQ